MSSLGWFIIVPMAILLLIGRVYLRKDDTGMEEENEQLIGGKRHLTIVK